MPRQYVRYVLCDRDDYDATVEDCGPLSAVGVLHRTLRRALYYEGPYLKTNPQAFIAKVTYERVSISTRKDLRA